MARGTTEGRRQAGSGHGAVRALWVALCTLAALLGVVLILTGADIYTTAHMVTPVRIEGRVADYKEILVNSAYARNELTLEGDPHTYVLDQGQFHPTLPERFYQEARVTIWVDGSSTTVIAITLYDVTGLNPVAYTTGAYDNPASTAMMAQAEGIGSAGFGLALVVLVPAWMLVSGRRRRRAQAGGQQAVVEAPAASPAPRLAPAPARAASTMPTPAPAPFAVPAPAAARPTPSSLAPAPFPAAAIAADVDEIPTQRTPAVQADTSGPLAPAMPETSSPPPGYQAPMIPPEFERGPGATSGPAAAFGGSGDERWSAAPSAPLAHSVEPASDIDELPTQRTPSVSAAPSMPADPPVPPTPATPAASAVPPAPPSPLWPPDPPRRMVPRFGPTPATGAEPDPQNWGVPWGVAPEPVSPAVPQASRLVPAAEAPQPAEAPPRPAEDDVEELPTERMPAQQPPRDVEELPTEHMPSISPLGGE